MTTEKKGSECIGGLGLPTREYGGVTGSVFYDGVYYPINEAREMKRRAGGVTFPSTETAQSGTVIGTAEPLTVHASRTNGKGIEQH